MVDVIPDNITKNLDSVLAPSVSELQLAGKPFYVVKPEQGLLIRSDDDTNSQLLEYIVKSLPEGRVKDVFSDGRGYCFRGMTYLTAGKEPIDGRSNRRWEDLKRKINDYGIEQPIDYPDPRHPVWMSFDFPDMAFMFANDTNKYRNGIVLAYDKQGLTKTLDYKDEGVALEPNHPKKDLTFKQRLVGGIIVEWPNWQSRYSQG